MVEEAVKGFISILKKIRNWFIPPAGGDWQRILFQPMLYLFLWVAVLIIVHRGNFSTNFQFEALDHSTMSIDVLNRQWSFFWAWSALGLVCPPLALVSLWLIYRIKSGRWKYLGFWLRLSSDVGVSISLLSYCIFRFDTGDYNIYPMAVITAATLFVLHLVFRDIGKVYEIEVLSRRIQAQWIKEDEVNEQRSYSLSDG